MAKDNPLMLAIDTSTEMAGLSLYNGQRVSELIWHSGRNQTTALLAQITHLLELNRLSLDDLGAIAVATGPGTFNGLRVGLSTAKGLGYGRCIPVYGVDTLEAGAYPFRDIGRPIRSFVPAGRGRVVFGDFRHRNGRWVRSGDLQNRTFDELGGGLARDAVLIGELPPTVEPDQLEAIENHLPRTALRMRRPACLAEIAWNRWQGGENDNLSMLEPLYVHGTRSGT